MKDKAPPTKAEPHPETPAATEQGAPGFLCPNCRKMRIKMSLASFLYSQEIVCPACGQVFQIDKSGCNHLVGLLQDLYVAKENVDRLKKQSF